MSFVTHIFTGILAGIVTLLILSAWQHVEAENRRPVRILLAALGILTTIAIWVIHLAYPSVLPFLVEQQGLSNFAAFAAMLAPPIVAAYNMECLLWPKAMKPDPVPPGPLSGFLQLLRSETRRKFVFLAAALGVISMVCMVITSAAMHNFIRLH